MIIQVDGDEIRYPINASSSGNNTLLAAIPNRRIVIHQICFTCAAAVTIIFADSDGTVLGGPWDFDAKGGAAPPVNYTGMFKLAKGKGFVMNLSSAVQVGGYFTGTLL